MSMISGNGLQSYDLFWGLDQVYDSDIRAATVRQRVARRYLAAKHLKEGNAESLFPKMDAWSERNIVHYPRIPLKTNPIDAVKKDSLVKEVAQSKQNAVEKCLSPPVLKQISFQTFLNAFQRSLDQTLTFLMSLPPKERGYVIVVDEAQKSNSWMVSLALDKLATLPPLDVVFKGSLEHALSNKEIRHIVLFDDAAYSGQQMSSTINSDIIPCLEFSPNVKALHFVIPFLTTKAKGKIDGTVKEIHGQTCFLSAHQGMPLVGEIPKRFTLSEQELHDFEEFLQSKFHIVPSESEKLAMTYFDHKIADYLSIPDAAVKSVVGTVIPPYKQGYDLILDQYALKGANSLRVDLLPDVGDELSQQFVVVHHDGKYFVCTKIEAEDVDVVRTGTTIPLMPLEMFELKEGDLLTTSIAKICFDGQKISKVL
jgi:hypothetical protein